MRRLSLNRSEPARLDGPEHLYESDRGRSRLIRQAVPRRFHPKESPSSVDLLGGSLRHCHLIRQCREVRSLGTSASAANIIARNWISRKAITLVLPKRPDSSTIRFPLVARIRNLCARGAAGRDVDLIGCKSDLIEFEGNPSMVCRVRHDERRHAGSAFNIENYGANHAHGLN